MTEQQNPQIDALVGQIVGHQRYFSALSGNDRQWVFQHPKDAIALFCDAVSNRAAKIVENLFEFVCTFKAPGAKEFIAKKKFVRDTSERARVRISWLGETFNRVMLPLVERDIADEELKLQRLLEPSYDLPQDSEHLGTIAGLGGMQKARVSLCAFYETLAYKQSIGDFSWLIGYVRGADGLLWAVGAGWLGGGWSVEAGSPGVPLGWVGGSGFLSR